ncbi:MAG: hypothetical protein Q8R36_02045 [bacterium]|nr:hypothetical protein [bacterium]
MKFLIKSIVLICVTALVVAGIVFGFDFVKNAFKSRVIDTTAWQTYTSQTFGFSVNIPPDWIVVEFPNDEIAPRVNMYPARQKKSLASTKSGIEHITPITHHSPVLNISVFPQGVPTEGFLGEFIPSDISFGEETTVAHDFVLKDGSRFATFASFKNVPASWNESGFVWGYALKKSTRTECLRGETKIKIDACDPFTGDTIIHSARMSKKDREIEKMILSTFKFIN